MTCGGTQSFIAIIESIVELLMRVGVACGTWFSGVYLENMQNVCLLLEFEFNLFSTCIYSLNCLIGR